tara:strand:- start:2895 stop:4721 length:1827 start_codon:yes stop_codon:yes gene_type:complete
MVTNYETIYGDPLAIDEEENVPAGASFPTQLNFGIPNKPVQTPVNAFDYYAPFVLDKESYMKDFATPGLTDAQIDELYQPTDFKSERRGALAKFGFGLLRPTPMGRIGDSLAAAGAQLSADMSAINTAQKQNAQQMKQAKVTAKLQRDAKRTLDNKFIFDSNRALFMDIANKNYMADLQANEKEMEVYNQLMKTAQAKFLDHGLEVTTPKQLTVARVQEDGSLGNVFTAFTLQQDLGDGKFSAPQYYRQTDKIGSDGLPVMELITDPANIVAIPVSMTGKKSDYGSSTGMTTFRDILSTIQTTDRALLTLDELEQSFREDPSRAGFVAGIRGRFQTYLQIFSDLYNSQFNDFFSESDLVQFDTPSIHLTGEYQGQEMKKFQSLSTSLNLYLQDPQTLDDIRTGKISENDLKALQSANDVFAQLSAQGYAQMRTEARGGTNHLGVPLFEATPGSGRTADEERQLIFKKLRLFDTELPANQVRANSIIYAIARARKSSGRLNLDDIQRAAQDLNIYGDSSADVIAKIGVLRDQLMRARNDNLAEIKFMYGTGKDNFYDRLLDAGYGNYDRSLTTGYVTNPKADAYLPTGQVNPGTVADAKGKFDYSIGVN